MKVGRRTHKEWITINLKSLWIRLISKIPVPAEAKWHLALVAVLNFLAIAKVTEVQANVVITLKRLLKKT